MEDSSQHILGCLGAILKSDIKKAANKDMNLDEK